MLVASYRPQGMPVHAAIPGKTMKGTISAVAALLQAVPATAQDSAQEALSRACNAAYVKVCKGIKRGPELIGKCFEKYPDIVSQIPKKCEADFQTNVENYNEAKGLK